MKGVPCYEFFRGIALNNHAYIITLSRHIVAVVTDVAIAMIKCGRC